ncbi:flagellar motor switch protein FliN [Hippea maritima]|uniref:Flagellar motor switch protein FliN n=1 Tax=Hippea maritima (strain ATCC 700847 / DSM 10411 / MH2) TaxID=760142 RepID=F2LXL2_HIPMA|nr:flagellar motor switch protein FliN [Hippea maritima]AEA33198.1 flagellar motor switch protein FliN [Hippea maritima DSM 10411]
MIAEGLSQDEIDSLLGGNAEDKQKDNTYGDAINENVSKLFDLLNSSIEEVTKTAFSLEVVSKFIDLNIIQKNEISFDGKIVINVDVTTGEKNSKFVVLINKKFASILSDLMLMGPGEAKEELESEDLDALKELFSQIFGHLSTQVKEAISPFISFEVKEATKEPLEIDSDKLYKSQYDVAIPNIENDLIDIISPKIELDEIFKQQEPQEETIIEHEEVPFKEVEEELFKEAAPQASKATLEAPKNLNLIMDIDLDVKIRIGDKNMLIKDILDLKDGSIIELDKNIEEPMDILVNGKVVAKGIVVVVGGKFGVKITHIETREERIKSLGE